MIMDLLTETNYFLRKKT